ncbi:MAG: YbaB/EbfC family nucleoid-associated protein [Mycoplasmataceae bacterium]|nr:YbaB/EbfC family nucleoid-associated protein [Mycoplasmataceae bacterium]
MNINLMMQQAKKMQADMEESKKILDKKEFKVEKQGVTLIMMGNKTVKSIDINEILVDPEDKDILEDLMIIAFNEAIEMIQEEEEASAPQAPAGMPF